MATVNQVAIKILVDGKEMEATLDEFNTLTNRAGASGQRAGGSIKQGFTAAKIGILAAAAAVTAIIIGLNKAVEAASNFTEANNKLLVIFKSIPDAARAARDELVDAYHMSYREAAQLLAATGDVLTGLGVQEDKALELSLATQKLAADITSFSNAQGGAEAVAHALTSAMLGEREALKTYGMVIDEAMVKEELRAAGLDKLTGLALKQAKAEVTLKMALTQSKNATGDAARTANDYASVQRQVEAQMENMSMQIGSIFIPLWNKVLKGFLDLLELIGEGNVAGALNATWEVFKIFGERLYGLWTGVADLIHGIFTLNWDMIKEGAETLWTTLTEGADENIARIKSAYEQGGIDYQAFLDGALNAMADNAIAADEMQTEIDKEALRKRKEYWEAIAGMVKSYDGDVNQILYNEEKLREKLALKEIKLEETKSKAKLKVNQQSAAAIGSLVGSFFGKSKAAAYAQALIQTYLGVARVVGQTGIMSPFAIPAVLGTGLAAAARISATKYALGGEINQPTLALAGEAGPEIAAPRKTFIDVANQMLRSGEIGGAGDGEMLDEIKGLRDDISGQNIVVEIDGREIALAQQRGEQLLDEEVIQ